jgi:hypothetical protein
MKHIRPSLPQRISNFVATHKELTIVITICMVVLAGGIVTCAYFWTRQPQLLHLPAIITKGPKQPVSYYSPLTGAKVPDAATTKREVTAIMIENSPDARPQSGLKAAGVVYEAIAEGGITRFLTLHQEDRPGLIGPVRSLRPYYIDWLAPYDASVAHVGGSYNALQTIRNGSFKDIDQFFNGSYYWRATDRVAPHNVYTNFDKLDALNQSKGYTGSNFTGFPRKGDSPVANPTASKITVNISSPLYNSSYNYDKASNSYLRFEGGAPHMDREAGQINPKVVVVIKVPVHIADEDGPREQMTTTGFNQAYVFQDGQEIDAIWRKAGQRDQIQFYDKQGHQIAFNAGQTWITAVAPDESITWQ